MKNKKTIKDLLLNNLEETQTEFCKKLKISRQTLYNIINKEDYSLSFLTIKKICKYFNVDYHDYI